MSGSLEAERSGPGLVLSNLEALRELLEIMVSCMREERRALATLDTSKLLEAVRVKEQVIVLLEERRDLLRQDLVGQGLDLPADMPLIDQVSALRFPDDVLPGRRQEVLGNIRSLEAVVEELQAVNGGLIHQVLGWIRGCLEELRGEESVAAYDASGRSVPGSALPVGAR